MSRERAGDDIPLWALRAAERAGRSSVLMALGAPLVGSSSEAYVQLSWTEAHLSSTQADEAVSRSVDGEGDPSVGAWRKWAALWPNARIVTANWNAIENITNADADARQVVGYITVDSSVHIGVLPDSRHFGTLSLAESGTATMAFRQGRHASRLIMGVLTGAGKLVVPEDLQVLSDADGAQRLIPVADLATQYPGTPLV